ncbi:MAG: hypothetical protein WBC18_07995 [Ottowia sp.]|uniref:hypothetical protein n=1 Tax=Ottowia sp. TaxID=1898956 RepID=UPI003C7523EF
MGSTASSRLPAGQRTFSAGRAMGVQQSIPASQIETEARAAASKGEQLLDACRYPLWSEAGFYFKAIFFQSGGGEIRPPAQKC